MLDFARREAKKMLVGKTGHGPSCKQDEINALMVALAKAGKRVVRLKGGDPMIFGRAGEEIAACRAAGIAGRGRARHHRGAGRGEPARRFADASRAMRGACNIVTGHGADGALPRRHRLAQPRRSGRDDAVYMPVKTLGELAPRAIAQGSIRRRRRSRWRAQPGRTRPGSLRPSRNCRRVCPALS